MVRLLLHGLALLCLLLAVVGAFLPLLPTTPFLLAALALSAKASPRLHQWLLEHPAFGEMLRRYQADRAISPKVFRNAMLMLWLTLMFSSWLVQCWWISVLLCCIGFGVSWYLYQAMRRFVRR